MWQLSAGGQKSIAALKTIILWDMADSIPYLVPTQFQESTFSSNNPSKIPAQYPAEVKGMIGDNYKH